MPSDVEIKKQKQVESVESDQEMHMDPLTGQFVTSSMFEEDKDDDYPFTQLECNDDYYDLDHDKVVLANEEPIHQHDNYMSEQYDGFIDFNIEYNKFSESMDAKNKQIEEENDEAEVASKMLNHLISSEVAYTPDPNYFERLQTDVTWMMRAILVDWMMEVCNEFTLKRETFHYSVNYVDRFLSVRNVKKEELQLGKSNDN